MTFLPSSQLTRLVPGPHVENCCLRLRQGAGSDGDWRAATEGRGPVSHRVPPQPCLKRPHSGPSAGPPWPGGPWWREAKCRCSLWGLPASPRVLGTLAAGHLRRRRRRKAREVAGLASGPAGQRGGGKTTTCVSTSAKSWVQGRGPGGWATLTLTTGYVSSRKLHAQERHHRRATVWEQL